MVHEQTFEMRVAVHLARSVVACLGGKVRSKTRQLATLLAHAPADARLLVKEHPVDNALTPWRRILLREAAAGREGPDPLVLMAELRGELPGTEEVYVAAEEQAQNGERVAAGTAAPWPVGMRSDIAGDATRPTRGREGPAAPPPPRRGGSGGRHQARSGRPPPSRATARSRIRRGSCG